MKADVIILGGGIIGCALAEELARRGRRVVVIERGTIGTEASAAAAGILAAQMDLPEPGPLFELCQAARRMYPAWVKHVERRSDLSVGYQRSGLLYLAMTAAQERAMDCRARWQRRLGLRVERWSPTQVRRREPAVDGRIACGWYFPAEAQVDNVRLMRALASSCRRAGVKVREQTSVRRLLLSGQRVRGVATDRGTFAAPVVVNCLGSWASMGGAFPIPLPVEPARGQLLAFRAPARLLRHPILSKRAYAVQHRDGRLLVGSTVEFAGFEKALTLGGIHGILRGICSMTSALNRCTLLDAWAGLRPYSTTGRPLLGPTRISGLYLATGHFRHGILLAPITAKLMAELILRGRSSFDLSPFAPARFSR